LNAIQLRYCSVRGEEGFPGTLDVTVAYLLSDQNELEIHYNAHTDQDTVLNLTNHAYFNLRGPGTSIEDHVLTLSCARYLPLDADLIPTGALRSVAGTPFDFQNPRGIGHRITADDRQLGFAGGYDHTWVIREPRGRLHHCARVYEPATGRVMDVLTTQPGILLYTGNFLDGSITGKEGIPYGYRSGFCLETQHFPNSPNQPEFPSTVLRPGQHFDQRTVFRFDTA
jgi:aldose 1-epimerase